jgi:hypothetical protein
MHDPLARRVESCGRARRDGLVIGAEDDGLTATAPSTSRRASLAGHLRLSALQTEPGDGHESSRHEHDPYASD